MVLIEAPSHVVDRIDDNEFPACHPRRLYDGPKGANEQFAPQPVAMNASVQCEFCEQDRGDLPGSATADAPRDFLTLDQMGRDCEVSSHNLVSLIDKHVGSRALSGRVVGVALEPFGEVSVPAVERFQVVLALQRLKTVGHRM